MNFRTEINEPASPWKIGHEHQLMLIGSCFAENIGMKLTQAKFPVVINPYGILFNPASVANCITDLCKGRTFTCDDLDYAHNEWFSYSHHGCFNHTDRELCLQGINNNNILCRQALLRTRYLILTLGSAYAYRHKEKNIIVGNCHKTDGKLFERVLLSTDEITTLLLQALQELRALNPQVTILFTVSPIRYVKYSASENMLSKAHLICAIENIRQQLSNTAYFPSYEIMMDDLRDYRFYAADMIHPNDTAIEYMWHKFCACYFTPHTMEIALKANEIYLSRNHIIKSKATDDIHKFATAQLCKIEQLTTLCPHIDMREETAYFKSLIP